MDDSFNEVIKFPVWPLPETAMGVLCNCLVGALPYTLEVGWGEGFVAGGGRLFVRFSKGSV